MTLRSHGSAGSPRSSRPLALLLGALLCAFALACSEPAEEAAAPGDASTPGVRAFPAAIETPPIIDTDWDGLPDEIDPDPANEPALAATFGPSGLAIERVYARFDEGDVDGVSCACAPVFVEGVGLDRAHGQPWLVFQTEQGDRAVTPERVSTDLWKAWPPPDARALFVVIGERRSHDVSLVPVTAEQPRLIDPRRPLRAGDVVELDGAHLDGVREVWLGSERIDLVSKSATRVAVRLPAAPLSRTFRVSGDAGDSNALELDIRRSVTVRLDDSFTLPPGAVLRVHYDASTHAVSVTEAPSFDVRAERPLILLLDLVRADGEVERGRVGAVAWPDEPVARVSARSTLLAMLLQFASRTPMPRDADWREQRAWLEAVAETSAAADFMDGFDAWLATGVAFDRIGLRGEVVEHGFAEVDAAAVAASADASAPRAANFLQDWLELFTQGSGPVITSLGGYLDDVIAFVANANSKGRPQGSQNTTVPDGDLTRGEEYSQFEVAKNGERRFIAADGSLADTICRYPAGTQAPSGIWPSDLCVQNSTIMHASYAVYLPDVPTFGNGYSFDRDDLVRRHIDTFDDPDAIKQGGMYLTANRKLPIGSPLCRMRTCYVEVLTGGLGLGVDVSLTTRDQAVISKLRGRALYENMLELVVAQVADIGDPDSVPACMANLVYQDPNYYDQILKFGAELNVKKDQLTPQLLLELFSETVGKALGDLVTGASGASNVFECLSVLQPPATVEQTIKAKFRGPSPTSGLTLYKEILDATMLAGGVFLTPEKFVFKVSHRAEIASVSVSGGSASGPAVIDTIDGVFTDDANTVPAKLTIEGTWLANEPIDDLDKRWTPTLRITDSKGAFRDFPLDASHVAPITDLTIRELMVPITEIAFALDELRAGPATLSLRYDQSSFDVDSRFNGHPADTLTVNSPVPIRLRNQPKLLNVDPPSGQPGTQLRLIGSGLSIFSDQSPPLVTLINIRDASDEVLLPASYVRSIVDDQILIEVPPNVTIDEAYTVEVVSETGRGYVEGTTPFLVVDTDLPVITFGDSGPELDDSLRIRLNDMNDNLQQSFSLPIEGRYARAFSIDNAQRQVEGLPPIVNFEIECLDPGDNDDCTYTVIVGNATIDPRATPTVEQFVTDGGKLGVGDRVQYGLDPF